MGMPLGLGGIAVIVVASLLMGQSPLQILSLILQTQGTTMETRDDTGAAPDGRADDERVHFVRAILGETEDVWDATFRRAGRQYERPRLVLFAGAVQSACGGATAASGPFYCPNDRQVYLDLSFFGEMQAHLGGGGDFAEAYVIAHEVGHHVQNLLGIFDRVGQARARGERMEGATGLSVRQELQADCFAGVWANRAQARHDWLEAGDVEEALHRHRDRRRSAAAADARHGRPRRLHARYVAAARPLVQGRLRTGPYRRLRYLRARVAVTTS